jgi:hypothetical protein
MKARKLKKILFGTSLLVSGALTSCVQTNGFATSETDVSKEPQKKEQKYTQEQDKLLRERYHKIYADSIRSANGYDSICNLTSNLWNKSAELTFRADSLAAVNSLGNVMQNEVEKSGSKILKDFMKNTSDILKPYNISLQDYIIEDTEFSWGFDTHTQGNDYDEADYILKQPLIYFGVNTCDVSDISGHEFDVFIASINQIIEESAYAAPHKKEIMSKINALIKKTKSKLIASRKAIERKYADYYVVIDGQDAAFIPYGTNDWEYGYTNMDFPERQTVVQQTTTNLHAQNLSADFFGDKKAKYKLINLGDDKWQVSKTSRMNTVETSEVFTAKSETTFQEYYAGSKAFDHYEIKFTNTHDGGMQITTNNFIVVKRAKSQWWPSNNILKRLDELDEQSSIISKQASLLEKQKQQINQYADSVANQMVNQYFQSR